MTIEQRVESLEKQNRKLKKWMAGIGAIALAALIGGTALSVRAYTAAIEPDAITTKAVTVKDASNRTRLVLDGTYGSVSSFDEGGKLRAHMDSTGSVFVRDANGVIRLAFDGARGYFRAFDADGRVRTLIGGDGSVNTYDINAKLRAWIGSNGYVAVYDSNATARVRLNGNDNKIYFYNSSGGQVAAHP